MFCAGVVRVPLPALPRFEVVIRRLRPSVEVDWGGFQVKLFAVAIFASLVSARTAPLHQTYLFYEKQIGRRAIASRQAACSSGNGHQVRHLPENVRRPIVFRKKDKFDEVECACGN